MTELCSPDATTPHESSDDVEALRREVARLRRELASAKAAAGGGFFARLFETLPVELAVFDAEQRYLYVNPAAIADAETRRWIVGKTDFDYCHLRQLDKSLAERRFESRRRAVEAGRPVVCEEELAGGDGGRRVVQRFHAPVYDRHGELEMIVGWTRDVTEPRDLEEQLQEAQRLESVGLLVGGIAHDFNNLLTAIQGYASLLIDSLAGDRRRVMAEDIKKVGEQAAALTRQLLGASRRHPRDPKPLELSALVRETAGLLQRLLGETIALELDLGRRTIGVCADAGQLQQVLLNLSVNSRDAMADQSLGRLTLRTRRVQEGGTWWAELVVEDTGCGMDDEVAARIFEPFYTTKNPDRGTGLGLSTVRGIVLRHDGRIEVESRSGVGTRFRILLPEVPLETDDPVPTEGVKRNRGEGTETVLVVEDEDVVRLLASDFLRHLGYEVIEARDGVEAEEILDVRGGEIDVVLSDVVMPRLGGPELARRTVARLPDLRWVFMSGYPGRERLPKLPQGEAPFLEKPFKPTLLGEQIRAVLDAS